MDAHIKLHCLKFVVWKKLLACDRSAAALYRYQFVANPGYNADRGPANIFAGRAHRQF
jgi:hypothetical protein